jgi:hypothetical protein
VKISNLIPEMSTAVVLQYLREWLILALECVEAGRWSEYRFGKQRR